MHFYISTLFMLLFAVNLFGQQADSCDLVGIYTLDHLEMSQEIDSLSRRKPTPRWSVYEQSGFSDTLIIKDGFGFIRSMNFRNYYHHVLTGQFQVKQDSTLALFVAKGQLFTMPDLTVERLNRYELVLIEKHKTRWVRRSFRSNVPIRP